MKTILFSELVSDGVLLAYIPVTRCFSINNVPSNPKKPFAVIKWTGTNNGIPQSNNGVQGVQIWVHGEEGSYAVIDIIIERTKYVIQEIKDSKAEKGSGIIACTRWNNDSGELLDLDRRTNVRYTQWQIIGR